MKSLKNLLGKKLPERLTHKKRTLDEQTVFFVFRKVVQEEFGNLGLGHFQPDYFSGKTIFIRCQSSAWASELWLQKNKIMRLINKELGENLIEDIKSK
jgi:predicted nucleic acid-binding Zn ribbon protein